PRLGLEAPPELIIRKVRTRWGSCSKDGRILINAEAFRLPVGCIDYLLVHELCHLRYPRHDRAFWLHVARCMPDWRQWKARLESFDE
ncbi:MAG: M48 family metallopeptidase, partial [Planctomycetota bacterium]